MINANIYTDVIANGDTLTKLVSGSFFKILSATGTVDVRTQNAYLTGMISGQGFKDTPFDRLELKNSSGASNTVRYLVADSEFIDGLTGSMAITQNVPVRSSSFANSTATVTTASAQLVAGNASRSYLLIQNQHTSGNIWIAFSAAATTANGIKISPGGTYEMSENQSTQIINAIGDVASNATVVVVQG